MSGKRSRATYEADLQAQQSPFVVYGTPLPPRDADVRDDGSYVPVWKQEVRDERGLKRLHGAFTGGFSAGYYNTVGSKEGWTPSTFVSSRSNRSKGAPKAPQQRPEDFMDDEDIADAAEAQRVQTAEGFAGLGSTQDDAIRKGAFIDLFKVEGETMGVKLLKKMGWKEGQGVGPKVRRKARLDGMERPGTDADATYLFAPENTRMIRFLRKDDHKGLGFDGETKLTPINGLGSEKEKSEDEDDDRSFSIGPKFSKKKKKPAKGGIGIGILNDTGSDDEDPYEIGPRISYNRVIGGDKKKKKPISPAANSLLKSKPVFISKKTAMAKAAAGLRKCHDGRLPLDGFILSNDSTSMSETLSKYPPPTIPEGWKSAKQSKSESTLSQYLSTSEAAKLSKLDPKSRASILGEAALPGKSVFDFLSSSARDRLAAASGRSNLPQALGEIPEGYAMTLEQRQQELLSQIPKIDKYTAEAALMRCSSVYGEDEAKRIRYRAYLEHQAGIVTILPEKGMLTNKEDWLKELKEFANCAKIFKPMTGLMATRFTSSSSSTIIPGQDGAAKDLLSKPEVKEDPAEQAAKMGMYGPMTREKKDWFPTRLLCKRFNVQPPKHVQPSTEEERGMAKEAPSDLVTRREIERMMIEAGNGNGNGTGTGTGFREQEIKKEEMDDNFDLGDVVIRNENEGDEQPVVVDAERNDALEGQKASDAVFRAVFGEDSEGEE
ncbi:hypothetical protein SS1G_02942 [Sclerotinia sclerotiorum 1980 UF-70]|uniref:G-patch domain-containing protein n=2 Tax=Sclerotinia sclerotiorum (strain ATCC 18683 / 1980 / Ss-1) TaxID=665079 RepID=A0A1D9Q2K5_SCLS1|nr:hypothetical protein SS1G_02942 [Sclerotinia sclerotiorum 1980 UF-70]APA09062.1 hypothetical protein sscle_04g038320 [Sclerotinia sclerotiorum 1980 UF-70]EDO00082.1 hypothetical protein SS1G_02942 [Sclerotinia sclerotiorum 1980 UF-70]